MHMSTTAATTSAMTAPSARRAVSQRTDGVWLLRLPTVRGISGQAMEPADVETEPANDGSRGLPSSQSLVILYRVSDSAEVPKRLIRTNCDAGAPSVPASHVRGLLAADGVDLARLLRSPAQRLGPWP